MPNLNNIVLAVVLFSHKLVPFFVIDVCSENIILHAEMVVNILLRC